MRLWSLARGLGLGTLEFNGTDLVSFGILRARNAQCLARTVWDLGL